MQSGAKWADSPQVAAQDADVVIAMLRDDQASEDVWLDPETGAFAGMKSDAIAIDSSTLSVNWVKSLNEQAKQRGIEFLEAPVSGSRPQADAAQLVYLVGGEESTYQRCLELLNSMGAVINYTGEVGNGALAKLCTNTMLGMQVATLAELIYMLQRQDGADVAKIMQALSTTSSWSPAVVVH